ncbi:hypothetical protein B0H66DRAFT_133253 [Apodospora peruviana]|uniref:Zn(2)-C6 fungal-type domain-containing protein n=1 Tax=Apodospora peruviana TaxID=516989 RepID=A0AAE0MC58_9PEZI|nr:hypothetical protein B0H66DRAFT_133253 [Apodospora peruviana]
MAEPLKRTFHGCLTCRKRKVRCRGGDPCQNCSRMNITCHSSFDTNLRIRVSTPTGQKDVGTKLKPTRGPEPRPGPMSAISPSFVDFDDHSKPFATDFQNQFTTFPATSPLSAFASEPQSVPQLSALSSGCAVVSDLDPLHFAGTWGFDFSLEPGMEHGFHTPTDVSMGAPMAMPPVNYDSFRPPTPGSRQTYPISDSEGSVASSRGSQDGTREWVPRRRKRPKKSIPKPSQHPTGETATNAMGNAGGSHTHSGSQDDAAAKEDNRWTFEKFVLAFVQKCIAHCPMRQAVLAWSAVNSASDKTISDPTAETWYEQSSDQVEKLMALSDPTLVLGTLQPVTNVAEIIICTSLFLNRYDILVGDVEAADDRLDRMTKWLSRHPGDLNMSGFASKLLLWACYLQIRISVFGSTHPCFTMLIDILADRPDHHQILEKSHSFYWDMFGNDLPQEQLAEELDKIPACLRVHETLCVLSNMLHYRSVQRVQSSSQDQAGWEEHLTARHAAIDNDLRRVEAEFELAVVMNASAGVLGRGLALPGTPRRISPGPTELSETGGSSSPPSSLISTFSSSTELHWLNAYCAFLTTKVLWSRLSRPDIRTDNASAAAVESILQIAMLLRRSRYGTEHRPWETASVLWPLPLFVAGVETTDEVRSDWVRMFITRKEVGDKMDEMLDLMEEVRNRQDEAGTRVYVDLVMAELGKQRGIFAFRG